MFTYQTYSQTFDWESAIDNGATVSEDKSGITATVSSSNNAIDFVDAGGAGGTTGKVIYTQFNNDNTSATISFTGVASVNVATIDAFDSELSGSSMWTFTPIGGSDAPVTAAISGTVATVVLNWTGVTGITVTSSIGLDSFGFDDVVLGAGTAAPTVSTASATPISSSGATLFGNVTANGGDPITERGFVYSLTSVDATPTVAEAGGGNVTKVIVAGTLGTYNQAISSLTASSEYSYTAYAINGTGTKEGLVQTFTTNAIGSDCLVTNPFDASNNFNNTRKFGQSFVACQTGVLESIAVLVAAGQTSSGHTIDVYSGTIISAANLLGSVTNQVLTENGGDPANLDVTDFSGESIDLITGQSYTFNIPMDANLVFTVDNGYPNGDIYVDNSPDGGVNDLVFKVIVAGVAPTVTTSAASAISNTEATLGGNVTAKGSTDVTGRGIVYAVHAVNPDPIIGGADVTTDDNGIGTGVFSEAISSLLLGTKYAFKSYATNSVGTSYGAVQTFTTTGSRWSGVTSTNWATATNWSTGVVPTAADNIVIPNVANKPAIESGTMAIGNNLTVEASSMLFVKSGGALTLKGDVTQNGLFGIESDFTSNGSFILEGLHLGTQKVYYDRYVSTSAIGARGWHVVSAPVHSKRIDEFFGVVVSNGTKRGIGHYVNTNPISTRWSYYTTGDVVGFFEKAKGYAIKKSTAGVLGFDGFINTDPVSITVSSLGDKYNAIGNPFTSFINSGTFLDNVGAGILTEKTIYLWDEGGNGGEGEYIIKNQAESYIVAPAQGFIVKAASDAAVNFTEELQTHVGGNAYLRETTRPKVSLFMKDDTNQKYTEVYYIENKTTGFDDGYDSSIFDGVETDFAVFTQLVSDNEGENLGIQTLPKENYASMVIPVGVKADTGKEISFSVDLVDFPSYLKVFIEDRETNTFTRLDEDNDSYKIALSESLNGIGRFYLHVTENALNIKSNETTDNISVYSIDKTTLKITGLPQGDTNVKLFNILGKQLKEIAFNTKGVETVSLPNFSEGVYIVKIKTEKGKLNKKIILK